MSKEYLHDVKIEGYTEEQFCRDCRDSYFTKDPSEFIMVPDGSFPILADSREYGSIRELEEIFGEDNESKTLFSIKDDSYTTDKLEEICNRREKLYWDVEVYNHEDNEDNTTYTPKASWWEHEEQNVKGQLESLKKKHKFIKERI